MKKRKYPKGIKNCSRPKMSDEQGQTWETLPVTLPDGTEVQGYYETVYGHKFYFEINGKWYTGGWEFDTQRSRYVPTPDLRTDPNGEPS